MAKHPFLARIWGLKVAENVKSDLKKLGFNEFYTLSKTDAFGYFFTSKYELITTTNKEIFITNLQTGKKDLIINLGYVQDDISIIPLDVKDSFLYFLLDDGKVFSFIEINLTNKDYREIYRIKTSAIENVWLDSFSMKIYIDMYDKIEIHDIRTNNITSINTPTASLLEFCNNYSNAIFLNMENQCLDIFDLEIEKNILSIPIEQKYTAIRFMEEQKDNIYFAVNRQKRNESDLVKINFQTGTFENLLENFEYRVGKIYKVSQNEYCFEVYTDDSKIVFCYF
ncbi:MAG: hypothetical protein IJA53_02145 [Spirochaetaceae bacterium]|nr:hypothetical protein [Spirochaetaceae bacterium]